MERNELEAVFRPSLSKACISEEHEFLLVILTGLLLLLVLIENNSIKLLAVLLITSFYAPFWICLLLQTILRYVTSSWWK